MKLTSITLAALGLAASASASNFDFLPKGMFKKLDIEGVVKTISEELGLNIVAEEANDDCNGCCHCVQEGAKDVMKKVVDKVKEKCEKTKCPVMQEHCKIAAEHKDVVFGMLVQHVRPASLAYAWCSGASYCTKDDDYWYATEAAIESNEFADLLDAYESKKDVVPDNQNLLGRPDGHERYLEELKDDECPCAACIHHGSKALMEHVVDEVVHMCEDAKCPVLQRRCAFAKDHKGFALGVLIGKVEPHKYAFGYCYAKGVCTGHHHKNITGMEVVDTDTWL
eukprot:GFYU01001207.1.p1 GENE.GFYU01001207.1~~GFYU01001207.1.p1  ORF type:complete len:291 (+),score=108.68 GFYU01001207.1:33-875(+)